MELPWWLRQIIIHQPMQETWVQYLGQKDNLEKEMVTRCNIFIWEIRWAEEPGGLQSMGSQRVRHSLVTKQQQQYFKHDCCGYVYESFNYVWLFVIPRAIAHQALLSMGFSIQARILRWVAIPLGDLPKPGIEPRSPALQAYVLPSQPLRKLHLETWSMD